MRNSRIELIKIFAMLLIVTNHVTRSIQPAQYYNDTGYSIAISSLPQNISEFVLNIFCYFGPVGNAIFLISSIWFLLEINTVNQEKVKRLVIDTWIISVVLCLAFVIFGPDIAPRLFVVRSIFPIICCNNWYITCYLILYLVHPFLNLLIEKVEQNSLQKLVFWLFVAYFIIAFISENLLYYSNLIFFISSYLVIGYIKKYSENNWVNTRLNCIIIIISSCICISLLGITWLGGRYIPFLNNKMLMWTSNNNPFTFFIAFSVFNLARGKTWKNKKINYLSSLTLLIYLIHENIYVKNVLRPFIWNALYSHFGYSHLILLDLLYSIVLFCTSCIIAFGFKQFNRMVSYRLIGPIFNHTISLVNKATNKLS